MKTILISYDLKTIDKDYGPIIDHLKTAEGWWHQLESTWIIVTNKSIELWAKELRELMESSDQILLIEIRDGTVNGWLPKAAWDWIRNTERTLK